MKEETSKQIAKDYDIDVCEVQRIYNLHPPEDSCSMFLFYSRLEDLSKERQKGIL